MHAWMDFYPLFLFHVSPIVQAVDISQHFTRQLFNSCRH